MNGFGLVKPDQSLEEIQSQSQPTPEMGDGYHMTQLSRAACDMAETPSGTWGPF